jgi:hypothetical protein
VTGFDACPICDTPRPANRGDGIWCCSIACYRAFHGTHALGAPSGNALTTTCPACQHPFSPVGLQRFCCEACRVAVYRRVRETTAAAPVVALRHAPRQPLTVYACDRCGARALDEQRCGECRDPMRRVGLGGFCPCCAEPVAVEELLGQEVIA